MEKDINRPLRSYGVVVVTRNGEKTIVPTLNSILNQTLPPTIVCIVNDGSIDNTARALQDISGKFPDKMCVVTLPDRGYDIRRVARNINRAIQEIRIRGVETQYTIISGDDCVYPENYAHYIIKKMEDDPKLVVASGDFMGGNPPSLAPRGSGRFIRNSFLERLGNQFPPYYGSESWILEKALQMGYKVKCFTEIRYRHLQKLGLKHKFRDWGLAMVCLGYHPLWVLYRCFKYVHNRLLPPRSLIMLWHYFVPINRKNDPYFGLYDEELKEYVRDKQKRNVMALMRGALIQSR